MDQSAMDHKDLSRSQYEHGRIALFNNKSRGARQCATYSTFYSAQTCQQKGHEAPTRDSQHASRMPRKARDISELAAADQQDEQAALSYAKVHQRSDHQTGKDKFRGLRRKADRHSHHRDRKELREYLLHAV